MNKDRRKAIADIIAQLETFDAERDNLRMQIEDIRDDEQSYYDDMPESFQGGDKGDRAQEAISALDEAISGLESFDVQDIIGNLNTASE